MVEPKPQIELFIDTSILISRLIRDERKKLQISNQLDGKRVITCSVVLHEFKRRVLKEARYLIRQFHRLDTFGAVMDHVTVALQRQVSRPKQQICLHLLNNLLEDLPDEDQKEIAIAYLDTFIMMGMEEAGKMVDEIYNVCDCGYTKYDPKIIKPFEEYEFGPERCRNIAEECGVVNFFRSNGELLKKLFAFLAAREGTLTSQMKKVYAFLANSVNGDYENAPTFNPCLEMGDLLIALESKDIKAFYTMNWKESQFYCAFFKQDLIVSSPLADHEDKNLPV